MKILVTNLVHLGPLDLPAGVEAVPFDETEPVPARHRDAILEPHLSEPPAELNRNAAEPPVAHDQVRTPADH